MDMKQMLGGPQSSGGNFARRPFCREHRSHFCPCVCPRIYRPPFTTRFRPGTPASDWAEDSRRKVGEVDA